MNLKNIDEYIMETEEVNTSLAKFESAINAQYFNINSESNRIIYYGHFSNSEIPERVKKELERTNYDAKILENEIVVLFSKPLLLSELFCQGTMISDKKSKTIRLISAGISQKKFVSDFIITGTSIKFKVNETVLGFILPSHTKFLQAKVIDFIDFFTNEEQINAVTEAYQNLSLEVDILKSKATSEVNQATDFINDKISGYSTIKNDIDIALKERVRLEDSNIKNKEILNRIQKDIKKENDNLKDIADGRNKLMALDENLKEAIQESSEKLEKEIEEYNSLSTKRFQKREEVKKLDEQIIDMKKDVNLTTLDMKGYSKESKKQLTMYFGLSLCAMVFLSIVFFQIYNNAQSFVNFIDTATPKVDAWDILVSRLPLITATTLVIGTLSALLFHLVNHIISVNSDNMNMLKASVLAEQITGTLPTTSMTDDEIRDYKRNTKIELVMNLLKSKKEITKETSQLDQIKQILEQQKLGK